MIRAGFLLVAILASVLSHGGKIEPPSINLIGESEKEFHQNWREQRFPFIAATEYGVKAEGNRWVITGRSEDTSCALLRDLEVMNPTKMVLRWRWRSRGALPGEIAERTKAGDDFAARVFVVFETSLIPTRTRAINYVWATKVPVGGTFPSPYTRHVSHLVLRTNSHEPQANIWQSERRDVLAYSGKIFGEPPTKISGVAIMVDSDYSGGRAEADFAEIFLEISPAPADSDP